MRELPDRYRQVEYCRLPLPKQHIFEKFGNGTKIDKIGKASF